MKKVIIAILSISAVALIGVLVVIYSGWIDTSATTEHSRAGEWLLETVKEQSAERRAAEIEVPDLGGRAALVRGAGSFQAMCATCHGAPGHERSEMGSGLNPLPPSPEDIAQRWSPAEIFWITKNGIRMTGMPAWGETHTDEELWEIVAFILEVEQTTPEEYAAMVEEAPEHEHGDDHENGHEHEHP